jgi:hypothetical protein
MQTQTYQIEMIFENSPDDSGRVDTITVSTEHQDIFITVAQIADEYYPAKLLELHCELVVDEEDKNDDK